MPLFIYLFTYLLYVYLKLCRMTKRWGDEEALKCYSDTSVKEIEKAPENLMYKPSLGQDFNPGSPMFEA